MLNDNTYKTNKYNMYLSVFMIKYNYRRFQNIVNVLVKDKITLIYIWILQYLIKVTDDIALKVF